MADSSGEGESELLDDTINKTIQCFQCVKNYFISKLVSVCCGDLNMSVTQSPGT